MSDSDEDSGRLTAYDAGFSVPIIMSGHSNVFGFQAINSAQQHVMELEKNLRKSLNRYLNWTNFDLKRGLSIQNSTAKIPTLENMDW